MNFAKKHKSEWRHFSCEECGKVISFWQIEKPKDWNIEGCYEYSKFCSNCKMIIPHREIIQTNIASDPEKKLKAS